MINLIGFLQPTLPYRFELYLQVLRRFQSPSLLRVLDNAVWRVVRHSGGLALLRISADADHTLRVECIAQSGEVLPAELLTIAARLCGTDIDLTPFYAFVQRDPRLHSLIEPLIGLPIFCSESLFEALIFTIIEQHIAWVSAQKAQQVFVQWANESLVYDGQLFYAMPTPERIAAAQPDELKPLKITNKRIAMIQQLAAQVADGTLNLAALEHESPQTLYQALLKLYGVGHWTAAVTVERATGYFLHVPHTDVALQAAANHYVYGQSGRLSPQALLDALAPYSEFAPTVAHFLLLRWVFDKYPVVEKSP